MVVLLISGKESQCKGKMCKPLFYINAVSWLRGLHSASVEVAMMNDDEQAHITRYISLQ